MHLALPKMVVTPGCFQQFVLCKTPYKTPVDICIMNFGAGEDSRILAIRARRDRGTNAKINTKL